MTQRGRLLVFGGVFATVIFLLVVVGIISGVGRNTVPDDENLRAGARYVTHVFQPAFSFEAVGENWFSDFEYGYVLALREGLAASDGAASDGAIDFLNVEDFVVFDPSESPGEADSRPAPKDLVSWLRQHPYLDTEKPEPVSIGGAKGVYFDAVATDLPDGYGNSVCPIGPLDAGREEFCISPPDKVRFIVLEDVKGKTVTILLQSRAVDFEEFLPRAQKLLKGVEWEDA
jgi:hypothetical protein